MYRDQERRPRKATGVFGSLYVVEGGAPAPHLVFGPVGDRDGHLVEMPRRRRRPIMPATKPVGTGRRHLLLMPWHLLEPHRRRRPMPRTGVKLYDVFLQLYTKYGHKQIMRTLDMCGSIRSGSKTK